MRSSPRRFESLVALSIGLLAGIAATPAELPVPCSAGSCGASAPATWVSSGAATAVVSGNALTVNQSSSSATLNWRSFNVAADGTVNFQQPDRSAVALNRIFDADPSRILGALNANGRVYLLNQNGILFGDGARVNVAGLVASSLDISPQALERGIADAVNAGGSPAFEPFKNPQTGQALASGSVTLSRGARIESAQGQVILVAPEVVNRGTITTPDGQTVLAAGERVYFATSTDPNIRGLLVEVGGAGSVVNGEDANAGRPSDELVGRLTAERGNVTLAGAIVRQLGQVSATTSTRANGTIRLLAREATGSVSEQGMRTGSVADRGGTLRIGSGSLTAVALDDTDDTVTVDANVQPQSRVELSAERIEIDSRARVTATAGQIDAYATSRPSIAAGQAIDSTPDSAVLAIASDAVLDVSGAHTSLPMERNVIRVELRGNQLADSPLQREGPLRSEAVFVDVREFGTREDGTEWVGTPLGDVSGDISNIRRDVAERSLGGGDIRLQSTGEIVVGRDANLDVSGGIIDWQSGFVRTSRVLGADGRSYDIAEADRNRIYAGLLDTKEVVDPRWGVTTTVGMADPSARGRFEPGYVEGRDAGRVSLAAPRLIMDGSVVGTTAAGRYQRMPASSTALPDYLRLPAAAELVVGVSRTGSAPDLVAPDIEMSDALALAGGFALDDIGLLASDAFDFVQLRRELLGDGRVGRLTLFTNGEFRVPESMAITLPGGGSLDVTAGRIAIRSDVTAGSGSIGLRAGRTATITGGSPQTAPDVLVASGVALEASGAWVNDDVRFNPEGATAPLFVDGGSIRLEVTAGRLTLESGSTIDVSAGAQRRADGRVVGGRAGSVTIAAITRTGDSLAELELGAQLRGYAMSRGGALSIAAPSICISAGACAAEGQLLMRPEDFLGNGFGSISLDANFGGLSLDPNTAVVLRQLNLELVPGHASAPTGTDFGSLTRVVDLPDDVRRPLNLTLRSGYRGTVVVPQAADLSLGRASAILADPGARVALTSDSSIIVDGTIRAPSGDIVLAVDNTGRRGYEEVQGIWLGQHSALDAAGVSVLEPNQLGARLGSVLDGGTVSISARRGYVVMAQGASIDVSGTAAELDVPNDRGAYTRVQVASRGGSIDVTGAEAVLLGGALLGRSGAPGAVESGSLTVRLDTTARIGSTGDPAEFPGGDRIVTVTTDTVPVILPPAQPLPGALAGQAMVASSAVTGGGFDSLRLVASNVTAFDIVTGETFRVGHGRIAVEPGVSLELPARLELVASSVGLNADAGSSFLAAQYLALTRDEYADARRADPLLLESPAATVGGGSLELRGDFVDVFGSMTLDRVGSTLIRSSGDIRLGGVLLGSAEREFVGRLEASGNLTLEAQQLYPSTLSRYAIATSADGRGEINILAASGEAPIVLSAGGSLRVEAPTISVSGTVRAPFGAIALQGESIEIQSGALLSVSGGDATVPFGTTQGDLAWAYALGNDVTRIFGPQAESLPDKRVTLDAESIVFADGAVIDISGGGDLLAYEFVPGPGGTQDVLSGEVRPDQFAILPALNPVIAPYDPAESADFDLRPGSAVWLSGGGGVAEGVYTLLPARYALLPGAYLVSAVDGYQDLAPGTVLRTTTGGSIVAGAYALAGTVLRDSRTTGFEVRPGEDALNEARYDLSLANDYFPALDPALDSTRLPRDAGTATVLAATRLSLDGALRAFVESGRGSTLEVAAPRLAVTVPGAIVPEGMLAIPAGQLASLGADTLILGGRIGADSGGDDIDVVASELVIGADARVAAPEVVLLARDELRLAERSVVEATGGSDGSDRRSLSLPAGAVLLRASTGEQIEVAREAGAETPGDLEILDGAIVRAPGSITLDANGSVSTLGAFEVGNGSLALGGERIGLGADPDAFDGIAVDDAVIAAIVEGELRLTARSELLVFGGTDLRVSAIGIDSPSIRASGEAGDARLTADRVELRGSASATEVEAGQSVLSIETADLSLAGGSTAFSGFGNVSLSASGPFVASGDGSLTSPGDLELTSALVTTAAGVDFEFLAGGDLRLHASDALPAADAAGGLGGALSFSGSSVRGVARVQTPSGLVSFTATGPGGSVDLLAGTLVDVAGRSVVFDGVEVGASGGVIRLLSNDGAVRVEDGATLDLSSSATPDARAGALQVAASGAALLGGTLRGASDRVDAGGRFELVAQQFDFGSLSGRLAQGGFTGSWRLVQTGPGDLRIDNGQTITASVVELTATQGSIRVDGGIDARAPRGGWVSLSAQGPVDVLGSIDARATDPDVTGGRVYLNSLAGVQLRAGSSVAVDGTALTDPAATPGGLLSIRTSRDALSTLADVTDANDRVQLAGNVTGAAAVRLEGIATYASPGDVVIGPDEIAAGAQNPWYADAQEFGALGAQVLAGLGADGDSRVMVVPGIEIVAGGDLRLVTDWNLREWRFGPEATGPGSLTLRASGDVVIEGSLSDGFDSATDQILSESTAESWTYRIAGGAITGSPDPLAVRTDPDGDVVVGPGIAGFGSQQRMIRTGTGDILIAAAGDFILSNAASVVYTAGRPGPGIRIPEDPALGGLRDLAYPVDAGRIVVRAGRDVIGGHSTQLYTPWLLRSGSPDSPLQTPTAWTVSFADFEQGIASIGGGRIDVTAGRDVLDLAASIPSIGRQVGGPTPAQSIVEVTGGGDLTIAAGGSVLGGQFYVDRGIGRIVAATSVAADPDSGVAPVLALGDAQLDVAARRSVDLASALNPTLMWPVDINGGLYLPAYFGTYGADSVLRATAVGGDVRLIADSRSGTPFAARFPTYPWSVDEARVATTVLPPTLQAASLSGSLTVASSFSMWPAPRGNLQMFARGDVVTAPILMSDAAIGTVLPSPEQPGSDATIFTQLLQGVSGDRRFNAPLPVHGPTAEDPAGDVEPARVVSLEGDVVSNAAFGTLYIPKDLRVIAARDISGLSVHVQHFDTSNVTTLEAGRDFVYPSTRDAFGRLRRNFGQVIVDGPGAIEIIAARDFDLQASQGIVSRGNLGNPALAAVGADVSIMAGADATTLGYEAFAARYLIASSTYDDALAAYVTRLFGRTPASRDEALNAFAALPLPLQRPFYQAVLFAEMRAGGRSAAQPGSTNGDFTRAFEALETYYPGSNPDVDDGEVNAYSGDIRLFFSRVYTLSGGSIAMLAPGGEINVGLATPPVAFGLSKEPSELGIVVQSTGSVAGIAFDDFQVNESRTFAADGGDILIWSTRGDIDAGRGAKTAISAPPPVISVDSNGQVVLTYPAALSGSGIQTLATTPGREPGDVDLFAPRGVVDAGDAGIVAGNLTIAATAVLGANNIQVSGTSVGVPVDASGLGASLTGVSSVASAATAAAETAVEPGAGAEGGTADDDLGEQALSWLDVFVVGLGEEQCDPKDLECLRRQKKGE